jgi:hypothetical protein
MSFTLKPPPTAYLFYIALCRPAMKLENPGMNFSELTYMIADEWHLMTNEEKKPYFDLVEMSGEN